MGSLRILLLILFWLSRVVAAQTANEQLTLADLIESRKIITSYADPVLLSPDGNRYVIVTCRGDLSARGNWIEFFVGSTTTLDSAKPILIAKRFTRSTAEAFHLVQHVKWQADSGNIFFLMDDGTRSPAIYSLNVTTHRLRQILSKPRPIVQYDVSADGFTLVYTVAAAQKKKRLVTDGGYVSERTAYEVLGQASNLSDVFGRTYDTFATFLKTNTTAKIPEPQYRWIVEPEPISLSPDGRFAVVVRPAAKIPSSWDVYTSHLMKDVYLPSAKSGGDNLVRQFVLIDLKTMTAKPLWNAPQNPFAHIQWSPVGRYFVVGPTFTPTDDSQASGLEGRAVVVIDAVTGKYEALPLKGDKSSQGFSPILWAHDGRIDLVPAPYYSRGSEVRSFRRTNSGWDITPTPEQNLREMVQVSIRQDLNTPPVVVGEEYKRGISRELSKIDPNLSRKHFSHAELLHWKSRDNNEWTGVLFYPSHYVVGKRYPLVIQTHGYTMEFTLDGGISTAFAARLLTTFGIAVLQLGGPDDKGIEARVLETPEEPEVLGTSGYLGAIDALSARGLVDPRKVGIIGFSRTGWHVAHAITHHPNCFAAAITADNIDGSYMEYMLNGAFTAFERDLGAAPFGPGLKSWVANAPGFNLDSVTTPLRIERDSGGLKSVLGAWEIYTGLRRLNKPVELFVVPDIEHGSHQLQHPIQRAASLNGTLEWFRFWLLGEEVSDSTKREQYLRWRHFRAYQDTNEARDSVCQ